MIEFQQKLIKVGSEEGVIIPKRILARTGAKQGDLLNLTVELAQHSFRKTKLEREYSDFVSKYGQTLENLSD